MPVSDDTSRQAFEKLSEAGLQFVNSLLSNGATHSQTESGAIFSAMLEAVRQNPARWESMQQRYYTEQLNLWQQFAQGETPAPAAESDRRFRAPEWHALPYFDYLRKSYQLNARWMQEMAAALPLEGQAKKRLDFFTRQIIDAAAPANFAATNPEVLKLAAETNGESLRRGMELLGEDMRKNRITMCDESAFEIGRNIAVTPGEVVFENQLMQLIQYRAQSVEVYARPLVMVPPCINKYYILDLQPENSFVRFAVENGHTVFMVSWRNVPAELGQVTWDQYLELGVITAISVARAISGADQVNTLGFCVGGTLLAAALAVLHAKGERPVSSATLLTTMLDFSDTGELSVFVDEEYVARREAQYAGGGVMRGQELAITFASLRANDLIWNYVVNSYLKGRAPEAFDLLYWNSDSTNLPGAMYAYYVRNTYLENNLCVPGRLSMCGVPVDLSQADLPVYLMAAREDHIVPWHTAWLNTNLLPGDKTFVLAASGHIAGVINPPAKKKRNFWTAPVSAMGADAWLEDAEHRPGSWWPHWISWLATRAGAHVAAPAACGSAAYPPVEPAPGRYVRQRCD
jgi:polyhydroxyalkanoate synthase